MKSFLSHLRKKYLILSALFLLFSCLIFCRCKDSLSPPTGTSDQSLSANDTFWEFTEELFRQELSGNTLSLHYTLADPSKYQLENAPVTLGACTADASTLSSTLDTYLTALERFEDVTLSAENQLTYDVLHSYLLSSKEGLSYLLFEEPLSPLTGIHAQLPILLSEYQFYNENDVETYLQLLSQIDTYFDSVLALELQKKEAGIFMPDYQIDEVLDYCSSFVKMGDSNFLSSSFAERLSALSSLTDSQKQAFLSRHHALMTETVFPAYQTLSSALKKLKGSGTNELGLCFFPEGKSYYEYLAQSEAGLSESIPEMQSMVKKQLSEDITALQNALSSANETSDSQNISSMLQADDSIFNAAPEKILEDLKSRSAAIFPEIPDVNIDIKYVSSDMEEYLSPAFYMIPAIDNTSENVIYLNKGQTVEGLNLYTTLAHEGYPGHLYQTVYFSSTDPNPIRSIMSFGGYVEGWATYTEMMSYYMTPLPDAYQTLFQKNQSIILGLYAYADMGIHYDGWSLTDMVNFFSNYGISEEEVLKEIYQLIIGTPANYLKYYMGYLKIYNLKKETAEKLGTDFSQMAFHKALLDVGPAPFDIVEEYVKNALY